MKPHSLTALLVNSPKTWPRALHDFLDDNLNIILDWEDVDPHANGRTISGQQYDSMIYGLRAILTQYCLRGYHCTKLTNREIVDIKTSGLLLQDSTSLNARIDKLTTDGSITPTIANQLKTVNQANNQYRSNMLWFCFYEPYKAGEGGIERFFRSWGGEALYNSHEDNPLTGPILRNIGTPCIIEAVVPMASMGESCLPENEICRTYLSSKGYSITEPMEHEGYSIAHIDPNNIINIHQHPDDHFIKLSRCDDWYDPLPLL